MAITKNKTQRYLISATILMLLISTWNFRRAFHPFRASLAFLFYRYYYIPCITFFINFFGFCLAFSLLNFLDLVFFFFLLLFCYGIGKRQIINLMVKKSKL